MAAAPVQDGQQPPPGQLTPQQSQQIQVCCVLIGNSLFVSY